MNTKRLLLALLLFMVIATLDGCAMMGPDDREFFGRGWINPKELDTPEGARHTPPDARSAATVPAGDNTLPVSSDPWDVPGGTPR